MFKIFMPFNNMSFLLCLYLNIYIRKIFKRKDFLIYIEKL